MIYFGFAIADSMFTENATISRSVLSVEEVREVLSTQKVEMSLNPSHKPTIDAAVTRFGLPITIPEKAPQVKVVKGDKVIVMSVRGLPRLENRHEYTAEEIEKADFVFGVWEVLN